MLKANFRLASFLIVLLVVPVLLIVALFSDEIMSTLGEEYFGGGWVLIILASGQFVNALSGSVGYLLNVTDHEADYLKATVISGVFSILFAFALVPAWGLLGAAISVSVSISFQALFLMVLVRKRLGFWTIGSMKG